MTKNPIVFRNPRDSGTIEGYSRQSILVYAEEFKCLSLTAPDLRFPPEQVCRWSRAASQQQDPYKRSVKLKFPATRRSPTILIHISEHRPLGPGHNESPLH